MELGLKNHNGDGLLGPNSIMVVYMDPRGYKGLWDIPTFWFLFRYLFVSLSGFTNDEGDKHRHTWRVGGLSK